MLWNAKKHLKKTNEKRKWEKLNKISNKKNIQIDLIKNNDKNIYDNKQISECSNELVLNWLIKLIKNVEVY